MSTTIGGVRIVDMPDLGAVTATSSLVGESAGSGRFSATSLQAYMGAGIITQPPTGAFFVQDGAHVNRITDRLFVGPAALNDGHYPNVSQDWLQAFLASSNGGGEVGPMIGATMSVLSINGQFGFVTGSRSSDNSVAGSENTIGIGAYAINDNTTAQGTVYAYYGEARRLQGVDSYSTFAMELDVANQSTLVMPTPYQQLPGQTVGIQMASGCGVALPNANDTSVGISFQSNPTHFGYGISFGATAIRGTDGQTGLGNAIVFAKGHCLTWFNANGNITSSIQGTVNDPADGTDIIFGDSGLIIQKNSGGPLVVVPPVANTVNYVVLAGAPAGGQVGLLAGGSDTDVDLKLDAKGAGYLDVNTPITSTATAGAAGALPATVSGYLSIKINGVVRKIPYYTP